MPRRKRPKCETCRFWQAQGKAAGGIYCGVTLAGVCRRHWLRTYDTGHCAFHEVLRPVRVEIQPQEAAE